MQTSNKIQCSDLRDFAEMVSLLQCKGVKFEGDTSTLVITITGY